MEDDKKVPSLYDKLNMSNPTQEILPAIVDEEDKSIDADFEVVQKNLHEIIDTGKKALDDIADIATQSQDAEAYTTVASMINSLVSANRELLDAHRRKQAVKKAEAANNTGNTNILNVNNTVQLTTAQLLDMLKPNGS